MKPSPLSKTLLSITIFSVISTCFLLANEMPWIGDAEAYRHIVGNFPGIGCADIPLLHSWSDIAQGMAYHYSHINGRIPVHTIEQIFSGIWPSWIFFLLNACVIALTVYLIIVLSLNRSSARSPLLYLFTAICFLFLANPSPNQWLSINLSLNYLWPAALGLILLISFTKLQKNGKTTTLRLLTLSLIAFAAGWSHEALALPLAGSLFIIYFFVPLCKKNLSFTTVKRQQALLLLFILLGAVFTLAAPGNWERFTGLTAEQDGSVFSPSNLWKGLIQLRWCYMILALISTLAFGLLFFRNHLFSVLKSHASLSLTALFSVIILIPLHTAEHSYGIASLMCMSLLWAIIFPTISPKATTLKLSLWALLLFSYTSIMIWYINLAHNQKSYFHRLIERYDKSKYGLIPFEEPAIPAAASFMFYRLYPISDSHGFLTYLCYSHTGKPCSPIPSKAFDFIQNFPQGLSQAKRISGLPFYDIDGTVIASSDSLPPNLREVNLEVEPMKDLRKRFPYSRRVINPVNEIRADNGKKFLILVSQHNRKILRVSKKE